MFNKADSANYDLGLYFHDVEYDQGADVGKACFTDLETPRTMQLYDDFQSAGVMAKFWFRAKSNDGQDEVSYVLVLFDTDWLPPPDETGPTGPTWSGNFPPLAIDGVISRTAESWSLETTKKKIKNPCTGSGNFGDPSQYVTVDLECATCQ